MDISLSPRATTKDRLRLKCLVVQSGCARKSILHVREICAVSGYHFRVSGYYVLTHSGDQVGWLGRRVLKHLSRSFETLIRSVQPMHPHTVMPPGEQVTHALRDELRTQASLYLGSKKRPAINALVHWLICEGYPTTQANSVHADRVVAAMIDMQRRDPSPGFIVWRNIPSA